MTETSCYSFGTLTLWLIVLGLVLALFGCAARAQPSSWSSYRQGFTTDYSGTDGHGGQWSGSSYTQGSTTYSDMNGPNGQSQHCRSRQHGH